jgi:flagellar assembly protein FliH
VAARLVTEADRARALKAQTEANRPDRVAPLVKALSEAVRALQEERLHLAESAAREAAQLAVGLARKIVQTEIDAGRHRIDRIVEAARERVAGSGPIRVRLHPRDLDLLAEQREPSGETWAEDNRVSFEPDASVRRGGCVVESGPSVVVNQPDLYLDRAEQCLCPAGSVE